MENALKIMNQMQPRKIDLAAKWLQVWEAETDKAIGFSGIIPALERFINEAKSNIKQHGMVAEKMKPFIDSAKELGAENIVADINSQLQENKRYAQQDLRLIQALERALQVSKEN
jgi:hypothetical protein